MRAIWLRLALFLALAVLGPMAPATAQQEDAAAELAQIDYAAWEAEVARAESLIESASASTAFLENLRSRLTGWRAQFLSAQSADDGRIETLEAQIAALGPPPEDGSAEPDPIAERRLELTDTLAQAQAPRVAASGAAIQAEGLIRDIDTILRERQQQEILELDPSPANPINWPGAVTSLRDVTVDLRENLIGRLNDPVRREAAMDNAPVLLFFLLVGALALLRGRRWTARLTAALQRRAHERGRTAGTFLVSLSQIVVPVAGVIALLTAFVASGFFGSQAVQLLQSLGVLVMASFFALWLAGRLFPDGDGPLGVLEMDPAEKRRARRLMLFIGVLFGAGVVIHTLSGFSQVSPAARGVMTLPVYILMGLVFWRFSSLVAAGLPEQPSEDSLGFARGAIQILSKALLVIAVIGPGLALVGYTNAAEAVMLPTALTLGILSIIVALQPLIRDTYAVVFRTTQSSASEALLPVLVNFLLVFAALPLIALSWGMRPDQLVEIYTRFWEGATLGGVRITPGNVLAVAVIFVIGLLVTRMLQGALKSTVLPRTKLDTGARNAVNSGVGYVGIALAAVIAITAGGIDLTALGVVIGALSVGIGFGLQNVVNNFVSGIILLIERPISEGDWIEVNGNMGIVKAISVRSTRIETFDRTDVIVPNGDFISGTVTNWTRGNTIGRAIVTVGVAYGSDTRRVEAILLEIARAHPDVSTFPEPAVDFLGFGADSLDFRMRMILRDINKLLTVKNEVHHRIAERFAEEGIEIPFAQRDIWLRNPETLREAVEAPVRDLPDEGPTQT